MFSIMVVAMAARMHYYAIVAVAVKIILVVGFVAGEQAVMFFVFGGGGVGVRMLVVVCAVVGLPILGAAVRGLGHCVWLSYRGSIVRRAGRSTTVQPADTLFVSQADVLEFGQE